MSGIFFHERITRFPGWAIRLLIFALVLVACGSPQAPPVDVEDLPVVDVTANAVLPDAGSDSGPPAEQRPPTDTPSSAPVQPVQPAAPAPGQVQQPPPQAPAVVSPETAQQQPPVGQPEQVQVPPTVATVPNVEPLPNANAAAAVTGPGNLLPGLTASGAAATAGRRGCSSTITQPYFASTLWGGVSVGHNSSPYAGTTMQTGVVGMTYEYWACGIPENSIVGFTLWQPDGKVLEGNVQLIDALYPVFAWISLPGEPLGRYTIRLESSQAFSMSDFNVSRPTAPLVRTFCSYEYPPIDGKVLLVGFAPGEIIELRRYAAINNGPPLQVWSVQADAYGVAYATPGATQGYVVAIGGARPMTYPGAGGSLQVSGWDKFSC